MGLKNSSSSHKTLRSVKYLKTLLSPCTDRSSTSGIDQSQHGGTPKVGSTGKISRTGRSLVRLMSKGTEKGAAPRQGVESSGLGTSTVKMDKERAFKPHPSCQ